MATLLIAIGVGVAFIIAYHTYGRWLGGKIFELAADRVCPSHRLRDDRDYVPTARGIVFGHHFTSIAATGPIVGPAIAVMWGWLPALLWVVLGSIFIGAVHDFGALVVSLRNNGQSVGDIAGRVLNRRVRLLFLSVLFLALTIIIAIFGLVIAAVFRQYEAAIFPVLVQIPIAIAIGLWLHRKGVSLVIPSILALALMYLAVYFGNEGLLGEINAGFASWPTIVWVAVLLTYCYIASVLPVWVLLQPRDYINALQLISALGLVVLGLIAAAVLGGAPPVEGADRQPLEIAAPMIQWAPEGAPIIFPFLFITIACGAISGFHCLVSSGTSSKQLRTETDAQFVGYGSMLTEGFLATIVILACVAGLGLGSQLMLKVPPGTMGWAEARYTTDDGKHWVVGHSRGSPMVTRLENPDQHPFEAPPESRVSLREHVDLSSGLAVLPEAGLFIEWDDSLWGWNDGFVATGAGAWQNRYTSWTEAGALGRTVGAFVDGSANFLAAMGIPLYIAVALMGVFVASFAATTLDSATRLQRYVIQELGRALGGGGYDGPGEGGGPRCVACGYDLSYNVSGTCPECGNEIDAAQPGRLAGGPQGPAGGPGALDGAASPRRLNGGGGIGAWLNPGAWLMNRFVATFVAVAVAGALAAMPAGVPEVGLWETFRADGAAAAWGWVTTHTGTGGMILWPMFGATNQLMGGLAFLVIAFWLWRRAKPIFFVILPLVFMLVMPAWAMLWQVFIANPGDQPGWLFADNPQWVLIAIALATVALEIWMITEALLLFPKVRGVLEESVDEGDVAAAPRAAEALASDAY